MYLAGKRNFYPVHGMRIIITVDCDNWTPDTCAEFDKGTALPDCQGISPDFCVDIIVILNPLVRMTETIKGIGFFK